MSTQKQQSQEQSGEAREISDKAQLQEVKGGTKFWNPDYNSGTEADPTMMPPEDANRPSDGTGSTADGPYFVA